MQGKVVLVAGQKGERENVIPCIVAQRKGVLREFEPLEKQHTSSFKMGQPTTTLSHHHHRTIPPSGRPRKNTGCTSVSPTAAGVILSLLLLATTGSSPVSAWVPAAPLLVARRGQPQAGAGHPRSDSRTPPARTTTALASSRSNEGNGASPSSDNDECSITDLEKCVDPVVKEKVRMDAVRFLQDSFYQTSSTAGSGPMDETDAQSPETEPTLENGGVLQLPLWRVPWTEVPGRTNVLSVHEPMYTNMFEELIRRGGSADSAWRRLVLWTLVRTQGQNGGRRTANVAG